jgi:hypothetical protein
LKKIDEHQWELKRIRVLRNCPRGQEYFCDGSVNKSIKGWDKLKPLERCPHLKNKKCTYMRINKRKGEEGG